MDAKTMRLMAQLKEDPSAVQQIFNSQDGKKLLQLLTVQNGSSSLEQAAQQASQGNTADMMQRLSQIMHSPEGAALILRIRQKVEK